MVAQLPENDTTDYPNAESFLAENYSLEVVPRRGWGQMGVPETDIQSVADHVSQAQALAEIYIPLYMPEVSVAEVTELLKYHDLPEAVTGDATPADGLSAAEKINRELAAMTQITAELSEQGLVEDAENIMRVWQKYEAQDTPAAIAAKQFDILEMWSMAVKYLDHYLASPDPLPDLQMETLVLDTVRINRVVEPNEKRLRELGMSFLNDLTQKIAAYEKFKTDSA